jgi:hypothetical protein
LRLTVLVGSANRSSVVAQQHGGRSWRPQKRVNQQDSRRFQILVLSGLLTGLVATVAVLLLRPAVPMVELVTIQNISPALSDGFPVPTLTDPSADFGRFADLANRLREANPNLVGASSEFLSVTDFLTQNSTPVNAGMLVYCVSQARSAVDPEKPEINTVELLSSVPGQPPVRLSDLFAKIGGTTVDVPRVLLLELNGLHAGLANGSLSSELPDTIRSELQQSGAKNLVVIGACDARESSWPWMAVKSTTSTSATSDSVPSVAGQSTVSGSFTGSAFSHFILDALEEGQFESAAALHKHIQQNVNDWTASHFGETQTVWIEPRNSDLPNLKLLEHASRPVEAVTEQSEATADAKLDAETADNNSKAPDDAAKSATAEAAERTPAQRLTELQTRFQTLSETTQVAALNPAAWNRANVLLLAARLALVNGSRSAFDRLIDQDLRQVLNVLDSSSRVAVPSEPMTAISDWVLLPQPHQITSEQTRQLRNTLDDFGEELAKVPSRLPDDIADSPALRQELIRLLLLEIDELSRTSESLTADVRNHQFQSLIRKLQNLSYKWPQHVIPQPVAESLEVLTANNPEQLPALLKPLSQLNQLRMTALALASGRFLDGLALRQSEWRIVNGRDENAGIDSVLQLLFASERWLCLGPAGKQVAEDRLTKAAAALNALVQRVERTRRLGRIADFQQTRLLPIIQYLALRLEETSLTPQELAQAARMAALQKSGGLRAEDFPVGQLETVRFTPGHIRALFALTRDFHQEQQAITVDDESFVQLLQDLITERQNASPSSTERLQLLSVSDFNARDGLLNALMTPGTTSRRPTPDKTSHSGIWLSFFSLRLSDALLHSQDATSWSLWSEFVETLQQGDAAKVANRRTALSGSLEQRWNTVFASLSGVKSSDLFASESEITDVIRSEIRRRSAALNQSNQSLLVRIRQSLNVTEGGTPTARLSLESTETELSADYRTSVNVSCEGAAELYVLNDGVTVANEGTTLDHNWFRRPVSGSSSKEVLGIQVLNSPLSATRLQLVAIDSGGAPVHSVEMQLQPPAENSWELETWLVEEGKPDRNIALAVESSASVRRLRLLPTTFDDASKMDVPSRFRLKLRRLQGVSQRVRLRALQAGTSVELLKWPEPLAFPPGTDILEIPLLPPTPAAGAAPAVAAAPLDVSAGLTFEIIPDDLPRKVPSHFTILPRLLEPDRILLRPEPNYLPDSDTLEISLQKQPVNDSAMVFPKALPASLDFSPGLARFLAEGANLKSVNADGEQFQIRFDPSIRRSLNESGLEFGLSVAGIPQAWWWTMTDGRLKLLEGQADVRVQLNVDNEMELPAVAKFPQLLFGKGWQKARFSATAFLHGSTFESPWQLGLQFRRTDSGNVIRLKDPPFAVRSRYRETVKILPGEGGQWLFSSQTSAWSIPVFEPSAFGLQNGTYSLEAVLDPLGSGGQPVMSATALTLDETPPQFDIDDIAMPSTRVPVTSPAVKATAHIIDNESGIRRIRAGLTLEKLVEQPFVKGSTVDARISIPRSEFPMMIQKEIDTEQAAVLIVEALNGANEISIQQKNIVFFLAGKVAPMVKKPGIIEVRFSNKIKYNVTLSGNGVQQAMPEVSGVATFPMLEPGRYRVAWEPVVGTLGAGAEDVTVLSERTTLAGPGK